MIRLRSSHRRMLVPRAVRAAIGLALIAGLVSLPGGPAFAASFVVGSAGDAPDAAPGDGVCATAAGACTLRAAIEESNAAAGADFVTFAGGVTRIQPASALPTITGALAIDGSDQSGFFPIPGVELDGSLAGTADGLTVAGAMSQVRGLAVNRFAGVGIVVQADDVTIAGTFVGTDLSGMAAAGNGGDGIRAVGATGLVVGGPSFLGDRTLVSGNARGVVIEGGRNSTITNALIGTDATTEGDLGNAGDGLVLVGHQTSNVLSNQVSGNGGVGILAEDVDDLTLTGNAVGVDLNAAIALPNAAGVEIRGGGGISERAVLFSNVIAANLGVGVRIGDANDGPGVGVPGVNLRSNSIGTDPAGATNLGNGGDGILIAGGDLNDGAIIGGSLSDTNRIAFNGGAGVRISGANTNERILVNSIFDNAGLGIDLESPANDDQQPPLLTALVGAAPDVTVQGSLSGFLPDHPYRLELFGNADCAAGAGEGRVFLGQTTITTDGAGNAVFAEQVTIGAWPAVTATATDDGGTSEFSNCLEPGGTVSAADLSIVKSVVGTPPLVGGTALTYRLAIANVGPDGAAGVEATDTLPAGTAFVSASTSQGSCSQSAGTVTCSLGALGATSQATVDLTLSIPDVAGDTPLVNTASVAASTEDPDPSDNTSSVQVTAIARRVDLSVEKSAPAEVTEGEAFDYALTVSNAGPDVANGVSLTDPLPGEVDLVGAVAGQGTCAAAAGTVTCDLGTMPGGGSATVTISVRAGEYAGGDPRTFANTVTVASDRPDQVPGDEQATAQVTEHPAAADVSLTKSDGLDTTVGGQELSYELAVINEGPGDATGVGIVDPLPAGTAFVSATASQGTCDQAGGVVSCSLGSLAVGGSATATIVVGTTVVDAETDVTNTASVAAAEPDPDPNDDVASDTTTLAPTGRADLSVVSIDDAPDPVTGGYDVAYTVVVRNVGAGDATDVLVRDVLPVGTSFVVPTPNPAGCAEEADVITCSLGTIAPGGSASLQLILDTPSVVTATQLSNVVTVSSPDDGNAANDQGAETTTLLPRQTAFATGFVPPNAGRLLFTDATTTSGGGWPIATSDDPTVAAVVVPSGPGGVITIAESACASPFACPGIRHGDGRRSLTPQTIGSVVAVSPPADASAKDPLTAYLLYDRSIAPFGWSPVRVAFLDAETGAFIRELPWCGWRGPAPACVASIERIVSWSAKVNLDLRVKVRFTSAGSFAAMR